MHATLTFEGRERTAPGMWTKTKGRLKRSAASVVSTVLTPHKASIQRLMDMPLTVLGTAGVDFAAFDVNHALGWLVTGASLFIVEHLIADDDSDKRGGRHS